MPLKKKYHLGSNTSNAIDIKLGNTRSESLRKHQKLIQVNSSFL